VKNSIVILVLILTLGFPTAITAQKQTNDTVTTQLAENYQFKVWWISLSIDWGKPIRGMIVDSSNYPIFDLSGQGTSWNSVILDLVLGFTPFKVSSKIALGFLTTAIMGFSFSDNGKDNGTGYWPIPPVSYDVTYSYSYFGMWWAISPMFVSRFAIKPKVYLNIGVGPSFWEYGHMDYDVETTELLGSSMENAEIPSLKDLSSLKGASGVYLATLFQLSWEWFNLEVSITGPDFFLGIGYVF
jgi:hypothetical protein